LQTLDHAFTGLTKVIGHDGQSLVETLGVEPRLSDPWRELLRHIDEEMLMWRRTFEKVHGSRASSSVEHAEVDETEDTDPYAGSEDEPEDNWDHGDTKTADEVAA
jgi:hypothetical protein